MWGRPAELKRTDAASAPAAKPEASSYITPTASSTRPVSPAVDAATAPATSSLTEPTASAPSEPVAPAPSSVDAPVVTAVPVVEPVVPGVLARAAVAASAAAPTPSAEPVSRRARRTQTAEQPVVVVPAIAPVAPAEPERPAAAFEADLPTRQEPAPLLDAVLAPAEPFELLEPVVADDDAASGASSTVAPSAAPTASPTASTWMAETFAKILAAEAAAVAATTAPLVETPGPQPVVPRAVEQQDAAPSVTAEAPAAPSPTNAREAAATSATPRFAEDRTKREHGERPRTERVEPLTGPIPAPAASGVDEFEAAARLFAFTGETPIQQVAPAQAADATEPEPEPQPAAHTAPRRSQARRGASFKRAATASFSVGVFGIVGLMAVGMTTPAEAVAAVSGVEAPLSVIAAADASSVVDEDEIQAYVAPGDALSDTLQRTENYATTTTAQLASEAGIKNFSNLFHNNTNSNIQWPFSVGVTMSYGFGMRSGRMHEGIDFTPGAGAPIQAIADGTVRVASEAGGAYGVHVIIDHIVDGELISSHYAHMQYGSMQVVPGQHVTVGTVIGHTGNTGRSYGAHTHFELLKNGTTAIDPWPWLQEHTDGTHTVG
ncbi:MULTISPECIES: peptidoglycan DD-metalloendopeptidase family protein [Microbacterium]|uniref:peptidoglycan DD-metalloendopeptidase family protein n=1 Tax=Microbacterium TaxID=33882 RepID=UPI001EF3F42A|nr:peptidoglycan DD-metalloendopeptidase family protein [Microbacterium sp. KCTC 39802]